MINNKGNMKQKSLLLISILLMVVLILVVLLFKVKDKTPATNLVYESFEAVGGKIDKEKYYIFGASSNIKFKVEKHDNFSYELTDQNGNKIDAPIKEEGKLLTIKAPEGLYEAGKIYHLKIENGKFLDEKYANFGEIVFKIIRPSKQSFALKENLIMTNLDDVKISDDTITSNNSFKENDIVLVYDHDELYAACKIIKMNSDGSNKYIVPDVNEIFEDIDFYGKEKINLANYVNDDNFNIFIATLIKNMFIDTVYAKENIEISKPVWNKKNQTLDISIVIDTSNRKDFLTNHNTKIELTLSISIDLYHDIMIDQYEYILVTNYKTRINNNLKHINNDFNNLNDAIKDRNTLNDYDITWLLDNFDNVNNDKFKTEKVLGNVIFNSNVPGLSLSLVTDIMLDIDSKTILDATFSSNNEVTLGLSDIFGPYSEYTSDSEGAVSFIGNVNNTISSVLNIKVNYLNLFSFNSIINTGFINNGKSTFNIDKKDDDDFEGTLATNGNISAYNNVLIKINDEDDKTIIDDKQEINKYDKKARIINKKRKEEKLNDQDDKPNKDKVEYKYTKEKVKELLQQGYNNLSSIGEWDNSMGTLTVDFEMHKTIDVDNNLLIGNWNYNSGAASYSCNYNYVNNTMNCNGFEDTKNYIKGLCDNLYSEYLKYTETGETDIDEAMEWEDMYGDLDSCYYEAIAASEPIDFKDDFNNILSNVDLSLEDLEVLKD